MLRKIQNLAELEQRWESEQRDVQNNITKAADAFFASYHLIEVLSGFNNFGITFILQFITVRVINHSMIVFCSSAELKAATYEAISTECCRQRTNGC